MWATGLVLWVSCVGHRIGTVGQLCGPQDWYCRSAVWATGLVLYVGQLCGPQDWYCM